MLLYVTSVLCLILLSANVFCVERKEQIISGNFAKKGDFPYIVLILKNNYPNCGGSIIHPKLVLSAAHCFDTREEQENAAVMAGLTDIYQPDENSQRVGIAQIMLHPKYDPRTLTNDIAVAFLASPLVYNSAVQPIRLPQSPNEGFYQAALTSGWGVAQMYNPQSSRFLRYFYGHLYYIVECDTYRYYGYDYGKSKSKLCTMARGQNVCYGDSGGPLVQNGTLIGVVSSIYNNDCTGPSIYTRVSSFLDFIYYTAQNFLY